MVTQTERKRFFLWPFGKRLFPSIPKVLLLLLLAGCLVYAISFTVTAPLARAHIAKLCGGSVYVQSGHLSGLSSISLKGLIIAADANSLTSAAILRADKIEIAFNLNALLRGVLSVHKIRLTDFLVCADYSQKNWNFASLSLQDIQAQGTVKLPFIELERGALSVRAGENGVFSTIALIGFNGCLALEPNKRQYNFNLTSDGRFGFDGTKLEGTLTVGEAGAKNHLAASGTIQMPAAQVLGNSWNLRHIAFDSLFDSRIIEIKRLDFEAGQGSVNLSGSFEPETRMMNVAIDAENIDISDTYAVDTLVYSKPVLDFFDNSLSDFLRRFRPTGRGGAKLYLAGNVKDLDGVQVQGSLFSTNIAVEDRQFPFRIERIAGEIVFTGRSLSFSNLRGYHDKASFVMHCGVENLGGSAAVDFQMTSPSVPLDEDLFNACGPQIKQVWYKFAPSGAIGLDYHYQAPSEGPEKLTIDLLFNSVCAVFESFPYPLEDLNGAVRFTADEIRIEELSSVQAGRKVAIHGRLEDIKSASPYLQLHVEGQNIPIDEKFVHAVPQSRRSLFDRIEMDAKADFKFDIPRQRITSEMPQFDAVMDVNGTRLVVKDYPILMTEVRFSAEMNSDQCRLSGFQAKAGGGTVKASGRLFAAGNTPMDAGSLDILAYNVELDDSFWKAVQPKTQPPMDNLQLEGPLNAAAHVMLNAGLPVLTDAEWSLECLGNPVKWGDQYIGQTKGKIDFKEEKVSFDGFELYVFELESLPETLIHRSAMPFFAWAKPSGSACILLNSGSVQFADGNELAADLEGRITLNAVSTGQLREASDLTGTLRGRFKGVIGEPWCIQELAGDYSMDRFCLGKCELTQLQGSIAFDPGTRVLQCTDLAGKSCGGSITGSWLADFQPLKPNYQLSVSFAGLDVSRLLSSGQNGLPDENKGIANGSLDLKGVIQNADIPVGRLEFNISDMRLGRQSMLGKLLTAIRLKSPRQYIFSELQVNAAIRGKTAACERVRIAGDPLVFYGNGTLDWEKQKIQLELVGIDRIFGDERTIVNMLARGFGSALWKIQVTGDLKEPSIDAVYLSMLKQPLEVFKPQGAI